MMDGPVAPPKLWQKVGEPFQARHDGTCAGCSDPIVGSHRSDDSLTWPPSAGAWIQRWDRGEAVDVETVYTHDGCRP